MKELLICKYVEKMTIEYPPLMYIGNSNRDGFWMDYNAFNLAVEGIDITKAALIPMQEYYLRGIINYESQEYVFSAKVDLRFFDEADYQQLIVEVMAEIKKGGQG